MLSYDADDLDVSADVGLRLLTQPGVRAPQEEYLDGTAGVSGVGYEARYCAAIEKVGEGEVEDCGGCAGVVIGDLSGKPAC